MEDYTKAEIQEVKFVEGILEGIYNTPPSGKIKTH